MSMNEYIKDRLLFIMMYLFSLTLTIIILLIFKINFSLTIIIAILYILLLVPLIIDYKKRSQFYNHFTKVLDSLDKKYLIHELISKGLFYETDNFLNYLYEIDKSYNDELGLYKNSQLEFKEYLELWCHEIKTPISTMKLIVDNMSDSKSKSLNEEIEKISNYIEQVLYYSIIDNVENDYLISKVCLNSIIKEVIRDNKKDLINKKIKIELFSNNVIVESDYKWLSYIIRQIVGNSIKYINNKQGLISFNIIENLNSVSLIIRDNGCGINTRDLDRVFNKGFTGLNGRNSIKSTGMGLYLCQKLCNKLRHAININSIENEYTEVTIIFPKSSMTR